MGMSAAQSHARLVSSFDTVYLSHIENLLSQLGIPVEKRNFLIAGGAGELPFIDVIPELWVPVDRYGQALGVVQSLSTQDNEGDDRPWPCPRCYERIEAQFVQCWRCGYFLPDQPDDKPDP
jgi:ferredoxin-thioredoxin reductase catalytic subunit